MLPGFVLYAIAVGVLSGPPRARRRRLLLGAVALLAGLRTVAGNGMPAYSGDGGPATSASLGNPIGVALDGSGNLLIADVWDHRIRKVAANGIITTVAGNGTQGFSGDGGAATEASLNRPQAVAIDGSGNLFIVDRYNLRVRKVDTSRTITTVAGNGEYGLTRDGVPATTAPICYPWDVAVDSSGNLFIAEAANSNRIRKAGANGIISTVAGSGWTRWRQSRQSG